MPQGDKDKYTDKQKRKAEHIEEGYEKRGVSKKEAESRAWATVNKELGGGNKSGSGRGKTESHVCSRKGGRKGGSAEPHLGEPQRRRQEGLGNAAPQGARLTPSLPAPAGDIARARAGA